jgi:M6 family metalloprotease-like protein
MHLTGFALHARRQGSSPAEWRKAGLSAFKNSLLVIWMAAVPAFAVPPAPGIHQPEGATCFLNTAAARERAVAMKAARKTGAPLAPPSKAQPHVIVLRIEFPDKAITKSLVETQTFFERVRAFYHENSYGVFAPTFTVSNIFTLPNPIAYYGNDCGNDVACKDQEMFTDTKTLAEPSMDFTVFDHVMLYHAGHGQETSGNSKDIWSVFFNRDQTLDGQTFSGFTVVPETEAGFYDPLGVICHEYGHQLGLPDLYDTFTGLSTVGAWDVMDYPYTGTISQDGSNPPHLGAWSKKFLGFGSFARAEENLTFAPAESSPGSFRVVEIPGAAASEYFLMEYRLDSASATFDKGIPMNGLVVWHIDDNIALDTFMLNENIVNSVTLNNSGHRGVDLVEADGTGPDTKLVIPDLGDGNAYNDGKTFTDPQSRAFSGAQTSITVTNIAGTGTGQLSARLISLKAGEALSILRAVNFPNPGGNSGKYPVRTGAPGGTVTTLVLQLNKPLPVEKLGLDIYTLNGDRVRTVGGGDLALRIGAGEPSSDEKWVYEYDWNGKNESGQDVVPGVYFYRFTADEARAVGKMMIVR